MLHAFGGEGTAAALGPPAGGHLHHPRGLVGGRDGGVAPGPRGVPYVVGKASLGEQRPRQPRRRGGRVPEAPGRRPRKGASSGVHCIGPHASELVHLGQAVMSHQGDLHYFVEAVFNYPTLGEVYKHAAFDARGRMKRLGVPGAQHAHVTVVPKSAQRRRQGKEHLPRSATGYGLRLLCRAGACPPPRAPRRGTSPRPTRTGHSSVSSRQVRGAWPAARAHPSRARAEASASCTCSSALRASASSSRSRRASASSRARSSRSRVDLRRAQPAAERRRRPARRARRRAVPAPRPRAQRAPSPPARRARESPSRSVCRSSSSAAQRLAPWPTALSRSSSRALISSSISCRTARFSSTCCSSRPEPLAGPPAVGGAARQLRARAWSRSARSATSIGARALAAAPRDRAPARARSRRRARTSREARAWRGRAGRRLHLALHLLEPLAARQHVGSLGEAELVTSPAPRGAGWGLERGSRGRGPALIAPGRGGGRRDRYRDRRTGRTPALAAGSSGPTLRASGIMGPVAGGPAVGLGLGFADAVGGELASAGADGSRSSPRSPPRDRAGSRPGPGRRLRRWAAQRPGSRPSDRPGSRPGSGWRQRSRSARPHRGGAFGAAAAVGHGARSRGRSFGTLASKAFLISRSRRTGARAAAPTRTRISSIIASMSFAPFDSGSVAEDRAPLARRLGELGALAHHRARAGTRRSAPAAPRAPPGRS